MDDLVERLRAFAAGCRGSMWQSRDKTIALCDEAADEIAALRARLEAVEKDRNAGTKDYCDLMDRHDAMAVRAERTEAALATARRDALEEAAKVCNERGAAEQVNYGLNRGTQNYFRARDAIRALIAQEHKDKTND